VRYYIPIILGVVAGLGSGRPRGAGQLEDLGFTAHRALQQSCTHVLLSLLNLRGGGSYRVLGSNALLKVRGELTRHGNLISASSDRTG
jgi:hypothetical protein